ncbi:MAG TPA: hypothetical protein VLZ06_06945 [Solirubrobacteraceae bacterium]|nr:hypothetical protein [Solirubrobacteraceae bacterium]
MSRRPLVTVPALTLGDLLLWHWSLAAHREVLALVSGLSLPPLAVASTWLVAFACVRVLARGVRAPFTRAPARPATPRPSATRSTAPRPAQPRPAQPRPAQVPVASADRERPSRQLAA